MDSGAVNAFARELAEALKKQGPGDGSPAWVARVLRRIEELTTGDGE